MKWDRRYPKTDVVKTISPHEIYAPSPSARLYANDEAKMVQNDFIRNQLMSVDVWNTSVLQRIGRIIHVTTRKNP